MSRFSILVLGLGLSVCGSLNARASLVAFYGFEDNASDSSGSNNNGALVNTPGFSTNVDGSLGGHSTKSLDLNSAGDGISVATGGDSRFNSQTFTMSFWVNNPGQVDGYNRTSGRVGYSFETALGNTDDLRFYNGNWIGSGGTVPRNVWTNVIYTHDQATNTMTLYVNGVQSNSFVQNASPSGNLGIGYAINNGGETLIGLMDDFAIWNEVLSASQISQLAGGASPLALPEPSSIALLGLLGLSSLARRRRL